MESINNENKEISNLNSEVNVNELFENLKQFFQKEDFKSACYYLNLARLNSKKFESNVKVTMLTIECSLYFKNKVEDKLIYICRKIFKYLSNQTRKTIQKNSSFHPQKYLYVQPSY